MSLPSVFARVAQIEGMIGSRGSWERGLPFAAPAAVAASMDVAGADQAGPGYLTGSRAMAASAAAGQRRFVDVFDAATLGSMSQAPGSSAVVSPPRAEPSPAAPAIPPNARFVNPVPGGEETLPFGPTWFSFEPTMTYKGVKYAHFHPGIDLAKPLGTPVLAAAAGKVIWAGPMSDGAVNVEIRHADGSITLYGHMQRDLPVKVGDYVAAGERVGSIGMTGKSTGPHLHFAMWGKDGQYMDPQPWLDAGHLPGAVPATVTAPVVQAAAPAPVASSGPTSTTAGAQGLCTTQALAEFDAVASKIPYASLIRSAAVNAGIDPLLLTAVVKAESAFQPNVVSSAGAMGLTQLMPATARYLGVTDPFDPAQNLNGGARYLVSQLKRFGRVDLALAAYQAGPTLVGRLGAVPDYPSTKAYIRHILASWTSYAEAAA